MAEDAKEEDSLRVVPAKEILDKIKKGKPVEYDGVFIDGDLDLSKEESKRIEHTIKITNSLINGEINFSNYHFLQAVNFSGSRSRDNVIFSGSQFSGKVDFSGSQFKVDVDFSGSKFSEYIIFWSSQIGGINFSESQFGKSAEFWEVAFEYADFSRSLFCEGVNFMGSQLGTINFSGSHFSGPAEFLGVQFRLNADFRESQFNEHTTFRGSQFSEGGDFSRSMFKGDTDFRGLRFSGEYLAFKDADFYEPFLQEDACRRAKNVLEKNGDRDRAGYHFYREMDGKRKQKPWYIRYPEYAFIQLIFGYGVHPWRLMAWWGITIIAFAAIYWAGNGLNGATQLFDYLKFSLATAIAPGYIATIISPGSTGYKLLPEYQAVAIIESIFGTFLWAGFIATFARKYMR